MIASKLQKSGEVRIGQSLHMKEDKFVVERKKTVFQSLQKLKIHCSKDAVPNIALLGSGGGQRAMVALLGSLVQLDKAGLLDCILYLSGVSGSTWCMASLYKEPNWSTKLDTHCKQQGDGDPWFEISPHEAGYSLTGAFVGTSHFGSQFHKGSKKKHQPEMDMLYLQALCGSALADEEEIKKFLWEKIKDPLAEKFYQVLIDLVDANLFVLNGNNPSDLDQSLGATLNDLSGGKHRLMFPTEKLNLADKQDAKHYLNQHTEDVFNNLSHLNSFWPDLKMWKCIFECINHWTWGRNYNFLHNMNDKTVPSDLLESEKRDYEDAGLLLNSPYFSVLREERNIDLIISLDFMREAAEMCKKLKIPFPEVNIPNEDVKKPKDFYVFKGQNTPTVIHIPLFNVVNCEIETWRNKYGTFQNPYNAKMISDLMKVAGKNISNNREKLLEQIAAATVTETADVCKKLNIPFFPLQSVTKTHKRCEKVNIPFPEVNIPSEDLKKPKDF
ncbi:Cytosolic phospholipase A2 gamma [Labeo rohita]|uniref:Cytosolic phospholipase A2 gamma n=1 Tax=Labeo rohita TaxID=84645 RepID=A0ABQ8L953_LABRO|nr:Cytosolic phospholipase A2 gamma [Labeo rohita]